MLRTTAHEFLLTNQLTQAPSIQEQVKHNILALVIAINQVMIDAQQQHLLIAMSPDMIFLLVSETRNTLVETSVRQQIKLDQIHEQAAIVCSWISRLE